MDELAVHQAIEAFLAANWITTPIEYPNLQNVQVGGSATVDLAQGTADYVSLRVTFGQEKAREVGGGSKQCFGAVSFVVHTREGNGDAILSKLAGMLVDLFSWQDQVSGVTFMDGRKFPCYTNGAWRDTVATIEFYFTKI